MLTGKVSNHPGLQYIIAEHGRLPTGHPTRTDLGLYSQVVQVPGRRRPEQVRNELLKRNAQGCRSNAPAQLEGGGSVKPNVGAVLPAKRAKEKEKGKGGRGRVTQPGERQRKR